MSRAESVDHRNLLRGRAAGCTALKSDRLVFQKNFSRKLTVVQKYFIPVIKKSFLHKRSLKEPKSYKEELDYPQEDMKKPLEEPHCPKEDSNITEEEPKRLRRNSGLDLEDFGEQSILPPPQSSWNDPFSTGTSFKRRVSLLTSLLFH